MFNWFKSNKQDRQQKLIDRVNELNLKANEISRAQYLQGGQSGGYDGADALHNVFEDFGYPAKVSFANALNMYRRFGPAKAVVEIPVNLSWMKAPKVEGSEQFNTAFDELVEKLNLWNRLKGLDNRQRVGQYAGMFVQAADGQTVDKELTSLGSLGAVHNLKPVYEGQLRVSTTDEEPTSENFGNPTMYEYNSTGFGNNNPDSSVSLRIHPSRLIMASEGADDGSIYGISSLEAIFNDLMDLRKISGAGGEGFYQNTRNAPVINMSPDHQQLSADELDDLEDALDDYNAKLSKKMVVQGMEFEYPSVSLDNPKDFADNSRNNIASGSFMAVAIIFGQQMGVRASDKDFDMIMLFVQSRRENFLNELVKKFIDWCIKYGVLPASEYEIEWDDMTAASDEEKIALADSMMGVNEKATRGQLSPAFEVDEVREAAGFEPVPEIEISEGNLDDLKVDDGEQ